METRLRPEEGARIQEFLQRYLALCVEYGMLIDGIALSVKPLDLATSAISATRNPDHSLFVQYHATEPERLSSNIVAAVERR